ncbi:MAG: mechanosensitive ion channel family protein [Xanthomonadales bacterium]|nr:mechanosensitive ion channel family protein [Xanthomonadales bacterium]
MHHWIFNTSWFGNSTFAWLVAGVGALIGYSVVFGAAKLFAARFRSLAGRHEDHQSLQIVAAVFAATRGWIVLLLAMAVALHTLSFKAPIPKYITWAIAVLVGVQIAFWVNTLIVSWLQRATPEGSMQNSNPIIYGLLTWVMEVLVWVILMMVLLGSAGVNISAFVASLGIGGIAVAMAAKNVLQDLFASVAIGLDKPFVVGETIQFASTTGTVKKVGIKSTRLDSLSGEELSISNSLLLHNLIHNYSRRQERRIVIGFHLPLDTPRAMVEKVTVDVNAIIDAQDNTRRDRGFMEAIETQGFRYEFVYYVLTPDYDAYVMAQQAINLKILAALESLGVFFAMPMRMMYDATGKIDNASSTDTDASDA